MIIRNGKIAECTNLELYEYWLKRYSTFMTYSEYKAMCIENGTEVKESDTSDANG